MGRDLLPVVTQKTPVGRLIDSALDHVSAETGPVKKWLSPSMFPICPIVWFTKLVHQKNRGKSDTKASTLLNIFAASGIGAHKNIQDALGHSGQMHGNWVCVNRDCSKAKEAKSVYDENGKRIKKGRPTRTRSENNVCPECGSFLEYKELLILYKGIKGYVDAMIKNPDGTYSLVDLKSTTVDKAMNDRAFVAYQRKQILAYAYVLKRRYGYNIRDYTLVYLPRDNPKKFVSVEFALDAKEMRRGKKLLNGELRKWGAALEAVKTGKFSSIISEKPCKTEDQYWNEFHSYDKCPFVECCFSGSHLNARLIRFVEESAANKDMTYDVLVEHVMRRVKEKKSGLLPTARNRDRVPVKIVSV